MVSISTVQHKRHECNVDMFLLESLRKGFPCSEDQSSVKALVVLKHATRDVKKIFSSFSKYIGAHNHIDCFIGTFDFEQH